MCITTKLILLGSKISSTESNCDWVSLQWLGLFVISIYSHTMWHIKFRTVILHEFRFWDKQLLWFSYNEYKICCTKFVGSLFWSITAKQKNNAHEKNLKAMILRQKIGYYSILLYKCMCVAMSKIPEQNTMYKWL